MTITIEATYENGVLKPLGLLPLNEAEKVELVVHRHLPPTDRSQVSSGVAASSYGIVRWTGDRESLTRLAEDPEFGLWDSP
jgi:predicted DNA-binding antitoxin AbrB/MazE fold protein